MEQLLGRVLGSSYDDDGFLGIQVEVFGSKSVGWFELSNPHGFQTRPLDPDTNGACQAYYWYDGSRGYATLANDPRTQSLLPASQKGETFFHGPSGAFIRFKLDGSISLFTTDDNTVNGRSVYLTLGPTGLEYNFPYGRLTFDANGFHVVHSSGARLDLGALAAPAPLDALGSYATLSAAMVHVEGSAVSVGPASALPDPLAKSTEVGAALQAIQACLDLVAAAVAAIGAVPTIAASGATVAPVAAAANAVAALQLALPGLITLIASTAVASP